MDFAGRMEAVKACAKAILADRVSNNGGQV
jgi:hypothetical protein